MDYKKTEAGECTEENGNSSDEREEMDYRKIEAGECTEENGNSSDEREEIDYKKIEAGECTEENGNSSDEREESSNSDMTILRVSGSNNIVFKDCNVTVIVNQGNKELTPSPSLGQAGSSKAGTVDKELTPSPSLGLAGSSKAGTVVKRPKRRAPIQQEDEAPPKKKKIATSDADKENIPKDQCSTLSQRFKNVKRSHRTRVEKEKGKKEPIPITKKVGELEKRHNSGEPYDFRELKVKATRRAKGVETLEAYDLPAKFKYKVGQEVKVASVKYHKIKKKFQTWGDCPVEKLSNL